MNVYAPRFNMLKAKFPTACILVDVISFLIVEPPSHFLATSALWVHDVKMSIYGPGKESLLGTKSVDTFI